MTGDDVSMPEIIPCAYCRCAVCIVDDPTRTHCAACLAEFFDENIRFLCDAKGEPYAHEEWKAEVARLERALVDARRRRDEAREFGWYVPARFDEDAMPPGDELRQSDVVDAAGPSYSTRSPFGI